MNNKKNTQNHNSDIDYFAFSHEHYQNYYSTSEPKLPLNFILNGQSATIYGGSCHQPIITDADIYVSLDTEQPVFIWEQPWHHTTKKQHIRFPITDMFIPHNSKEFKECVNYVKNCISKGKKVHVGCIGGHGRTGMFLSSIIAQCMGDQLVDNLGQPISAIDYVRQNYAKKSVETVPQILFLHYNFNIAFPKDNQEDIAYFLQCFEKNMGISLDNTIKQGIAFDQLHTVLKEIENIIYCQPTLSHKITKQKK